MNCKCLHLSSVGKKILMALSGLVLVGFICGHLAGNLTIYGGPEMLNGYAAKLHKLGPFLWVFRSTLIVAVLVHIACAVLLTLENKKARPIGYKKLDTQVTTYSARTMPVSGLVILGFIIYHLLHFTFRTTNPEVLFYDGQGHLDVFKMVVLSFKQPAISIVYIISLSLLCLHLAHGIFSMFQSLGVTCEKTLKVLRNLSQLIASVIYLGYVAIPVSVLLGWITLESYGGHL